MPAHGLPHPSYAARFGPLRLFSSALPRERQQDASQQTRVPSPSQTAANDADADDLADLDFSYEPYFERLGPPPAHLMPPKGVSERWELASPPPSPSPSVTLRGLREPTGAASPAVGTDEAGTASAPPPPPPPPRSATSTPTQLLTHVDPADHTRARMVDVSDKCPTSRTGTAVGRVYLPAHALALIRASEEGASSSGGGGVGGWKGKGPVLRTAQLAGIMGAKRTAELIPLCHPLPLSHVDVVLELVVDHADAGGPAGADSDAERWREEEPKQKQKQKQKQREEEEARGAALASSEAFLQQATGGLRAGAGEMFGGRSSSSEDEDGPAAAAAGDVGFRIEDLIDGDRWHGRELDLNDLGGRGHHDVASGSSHPGSSPAPPTMQELQPSARPAAAAGYVQVTCTARTTGPTGVEMEALVGANVACLTVWDMVKAVAGREMWIGDVKVVKKTGGKSGDWERE